MHQLLERSHVLGERVDYWGDVFTSAHYDELKLAQMVVGRGFECRADHSFQNFIAHLAVGVVAAGAAFLQCFVQFHNVGI